MPWYRRVQLELRCVYQMFPGGLPVSEWAFNLKPTARRVDNHGCPCVWLALGLRLLGLDVGAGVFVSLRKKA